MAKTVAPLILFFVTFGCVCSYYYPGYSQPYAQPSFPPPPPRPHYMGYQQPGPFMSASVPTPYQAPQFAGAAYMPRPPPYAYAQPPPPRLMYPRAPPYMPAASYHHNQYFKHPVNPPFAAAPPATHGHFHQHHRPQLPKMRFPFGNKFNPHHDQMSAHSHQASRSTFFSKIKPFLLGTQPKSVPPHPYYSNHYQPHHFTPSVPYQNKHHHHQSYHHQYHHRPQAPATFHSAGAMPMIQPYMQQEHSCSCSLHVGDLIVYKHTDMRASYSCSDLADCKSFCTNLFSSEDLRAQTRADACLLMARDGSWPWFRRDQVCGAFGVKNDTKLSVDLCCKDLQAC